MQVFSKQSFEEIRRWMYRNARPIELARWQYHFESGTKETVLCALLAFQNEDGGYGHGLECDNWNPNSTPYTTGLAIEIFRELEIYNPHHPIVEKAFDFLDSGVFFTDKGWLFTIPSNNGYPHASWWTYSQENNEYNGYHATGGIVGYILRCGDKESHLYQKALSVAEGMVDKLRQSKVLEKHEVGAYCTLLNDIIAAKLTDYFDCAYLNECLKVIVNDSIERNPAKWPFYSMRPSKYIDSVENMFYLDNKEVIEKEMDYILSSRQPYGVWDITWKWEGYPEEFAISERWWQGFWAIKNLLILKSFGRYIDN